MVEEGESRRVEEEGEEEGEREREGGEGGRRGGGCVLNISPDACVPATGGCMFPPLLHAHSNHAK